MEKNPKLRTTIDIQLVKNGEDEQIVFLDRQRIAPSPVLLPRAFGVVLGMFTGEFSRDDILARCISQGLTLEILDQLITELDAAYFLDSEGFRNEERRIRESFLSKPSRPPSCAGAVYPATEEGLSDYLDKEISDKDGSVPGDRKGFPLALVIPHIDYTRGGRVYAEVSRYLSGFSDTPDVLVMLGTSHYGGVSKYQLSRMDYEIPGTVFKNARDISSEIAAAYGEEMAFHDEFLHAHEHSLELPLPYLWYAWKEQRQLPEIVPVLIGSFYESFDMSGGALSIPEVSRMLVILGDTLTELRASGKKVMLVCGVDFSHVGQGFGDKDRMTADDLVRVEEYDRSLLYAIERLDADGFEQIIRSTRDATRVCGYPSLFTLLKTFEYLGITPKAEVLDYMMHTTPGTDTTVSFAGLGFVE
jgi:MEMO1 family protein